MTDIQIVTDITKTGYIGVYETNLGSVCPSCVVVTGRKFTRLNPVFINPLNSYKQALFVVKPEYKIITAVRVNDVVQFKIKEIVSVHSNKIMTNTIELKSVRAYNPDSTVASVDLKQFTDDENLADTMLHIIKKLSRKHQDEIYAKPPQVLEFHPSDGNGIANKMLKKYEERFGKVDLPPLSIPKRSTENR